MIASLHGTVSDTQLDLLILDVSGVGYGINVTTEDQSKLPQGNPAKLFIYEHIREQSHDLFGFISLETKNLFELLLGVNGVGPKMALNVLNIGKSQEVRQAIAGGDTKAIQLASGVGKRVAERIIVDLKDKVGLVGVDLATTGMLQSSENAIHDEAVEALMALGYSANDAAVALHGIDPLLSTAERIKLALSPRKS